MKRIFIAVRIVPEEALSAMIASFRNGMPDDRIKWTDTGNIHITLAFPGNTEDSIIPAISRMLSEKCSAYEEFEIEIKGAGVFKSIADPRILWAGIERQEKLSALAHIVADGLNDLGIQLEDRPYNPHLTIGRIKHITDRESFTKLIAKYRDQKLQTIRVKEIILYESILKQTGPEYKPLGVFKLGLFEKTV